MTIKDQLYQLEKNFTKKFAALEEQFSLFKEDMRKDITPLRDYVVGQQAIKELENGKNVSISPSVLNIIKWLALAVATLVTGKVLL